MRILLAIDNSDCSAAAIEAVITQFTTRHVQVHVLHADEWPEQMPPAMAFAEGEEGVGSVLGLHALRRRDAAALVESAAEQLRSAGFTTAASIRQGDAPRVIVDCAKEIGADLIVLGSHGRKGFDRLLLGSVSDSVARHAPCSVQIVRAAPRAA